MSTTADDVQPLLPELVPVSSESAVAHAVVASSDNKKQEQDPFADPAPAPESGADPAKHPFAVSQRTENQTPPSIMIENYRPVNSVDKKGNVTSHDHMLNTSPELLLRFIAEQNELAPPLVASVRGTTKKTDLSGRTVSHEDFYFTVPCADAVTLSLGEGFAPLTYTAGEWELACRGAAPPFESADGDARCQRKHPFKSDSAPPLTRTPSMTESAWKQRRGHNYEVTVNYVSKAKLVAEKAERLAKGAPGFVHPGSLDDVVNPTFPHDSSYPPLLFKDQFLDLDDAHSTSPVPPLFGAQHDESARERARRAEDLRSAVEEYCASKDPLKSLTLTREYYGWEWETLKAGIESSLQASSYAGQVYVEFNDTPTTLTIRPSNGFSKVLSAHIATKISLSLILVYPTVKFIESIWAPRFDQLRVAVPLTRWRRLPPPTNTDNKGYTLSSAREQASTLLPSRPSPKVAPLPGETSTEWVYLTGLQEGEWLRKWEKAMVVAVKEKIRGGGLLRLEDGAREWGARGHLRGYNDEV